MTKQKTKQMLKALDETYGTTKEGFVHAADWQLLTAIMLSAQSTDKQVGEALPGLWSAFPTLEIAAGASVDEIQREIRSIGLYKVKAKHMQSCCRQLLAAYNGKVPVTIEELISLPGVGRKTATLFLADAYGIPGVTVDTHVFRISRRIGWAKGKNPVQVEQELMKELPIEHWNRINFQLIYHGRSICKARKCLCESCALDSWCEKHEIS